MKQQIIRLLGQLVMPCLNDITFSYDKELFETAITNFASGATSKCTPIYAYLRVKEGVKQEQVENSVIKLNYNDGEKKSV